VRLAVGQARELTAEGSGVGEAVSEGVGVASAVGVGVASAVGETDGTSVGMMDGSGTGVAGWIRCRDPLGCGVAWPAGWGTGAGAGAGFGSSLGSILSGCETSVWNSWIVCPVDRPSSLALTSNMANANAPNTRPIVPRTCHQSNRFRRIHRRTPRALRESIAGPPFPAMSRLSF